MFLALPAIILFGHIDNASLIENPIASPLPIQKKAHPDPHQNLEEIVVSSHPLGQNKGDIGQAISLLAGEALERNRSLTLGASLDKLPGIAQSSFGPAVSRPIIRGLGGDRIRILTNGLGTIDAANVSPDHGTAIDPERAEKIEILRGASTLLYGSNAIGGVVNVFDGRIPTQHPENGIKGYGQSHYATNAQERSLASGLSASLAENWVFHIDASYLKRGDLDIKGAALSDNLIARLEAADPDFKRADLPQGTVPNSGSERYSVAAGFSYIQPNGFIGASLSYYDNFYDVPLSEESPEQAASSEQAEEDPIHIALDQWRADLISEWDADLLAFQALKFRFSYGDYAHEEREGTEVGTRFLNEGFETRLELIQKPLGRLNCVWGSQYRYRDFAALGEEAFVPPSTTKQIGFFILESLKFSSLSWEAGLRLDHQKIDARAFATENENTEDLNTVPSILADNDLPENNINRFSRSDTLFSASSGVTWELSPLWKIALSGQYSERAPTVEELLSNGAHFATASFEQGNPTLAIEKARNIDLRLQYENAHIAASLTYFTNYFDDFIFQAPTGLQREGLNIFLYQASDAHFQGFEFEANAHLYETNGHRLNLEITSDYVRASTRGQDPRALPRIPPFSAAIGFDYQGPWLDIHTHLTWQAAQNRRADFESPTDDFTDLSITLTSHPFGPDAGLRLFLEGSNLLDAEIRQATSFLKDRTPSAGRGLRFGVKYDF